MPGCRDTFIYEYLGDVVSQPSFLKRMRLYAEEGIRHFYFMMLQKDEVSYPYSLPVLALRDWLASSSTPQKEAASGVSQTTAATRTAMLQNGQWVITCVWASSRTGTSRRTRNSRSTITSTAMGESYTSLAQARRVAHAIVFSHDAQPCYCGEPNCVGFIGGKTQTDIAAMDDLYLDGKYRPLSMR